MKSATAVCALVSVLSVAACGQEGGPTEARLGTATVTGAPAPAQPAAGGVATPPGPAAPARPVTPEAVARAYLQAGAAQDAARIRALLDPACHGNEGAMRVDAVRMMGVVMTVASLEVRPAAVTGESATVAYTVRGSAHGDGAETTLFGAKVKMQSVHMEGASRSGTLRLRRIGRDWKVACEGSPAAP